MKECFPTQYKILGEGENITIEPIAASTPEGTSVLSQTIINVVEETTVKFDKQSFSSPPITIVNEKKGKCCACCGVCSCKKILKFFKYLNPCYKKPLVTFTDDTTDKSIGDKKQTQESIGDKKDSINDYKFSSQDKEAIIDVDQPSSSKITP